MTKKESKEKRIEDIVNAAIEEFIEKGYEGTSMESIARKAGVSKGGLYHYFSSKDEVLVYANEKLTEPVYAMMGAAMQNPDAAACIRNYIHDYLEYWSMHTRELVFFFLSMTKALSCNEIWGMYDEYAKGMLEFFEGLFLKGVQSGTFLQHDTKTSAVTLMSALDGVTAYLIMCKDLRLEDVVESFGAKFVDSVLAKE